MVRVYIGTRAPTTYLPTLSAPTHPLCPSLPLSAPLCPYCRVPIVLIIINLARHLLSVLGYLRDLATRRRVALSTPILYASVQTVHAARSASVATGQ